MNSEKIIGHGAEAIIIEKDKVIKRRISKSYRLPQIDEQIRKLRTRAETKILEKAGKIISVPKVLKSNEKTKEIIMEFIDGKKLSEELDNFPLEKQKEICKEIGISISKLHDENIIHGDLTTSNIILVDDNSELICSQPKDNGSGEEKIQCKKLGGIVSKFKLFFIDFGLGFHSQKLEDKAVDIHLIKQALEAKHFQHFEILTKEFRKGYSNSKNSEAVLKQLEKVEKRGRYKGD